MYQINFKKKALRRATILAYILIFNITAPLTAATKTENIIAGLECVEKLAETLTPEEVFTLTEILSECDDENISRILQTGEKAAAATNAAI